MLSGVTAVVSSGNSGPNRYTLGSPGASAMAITVGNSTGPSQVITANTHFWIGEEGEETAPEQQPAPESEQTPELGNAPETQEPAVIPVTAPEDGAETTTSDDEAEGASSVQPEADQGEAAAANAGNETTDEVTSPSTEGTDTVLPSDTEQETAAPANTEQTPLGVTESVYRLDVMGWSLAADPGSDFDRSV